MTPKSRCSHGFVWRTSQLSVPWGWAKTLPPAWHGKHSPGASAPEHEGSAFPKNSELAFPFFQQVPFGLTLIFKEVCWVESGSESPFPSGILSSFQCVRAWRFYMDRMKADGSSASASGGARCRAGGWDTGIPGCPGPEKREILFPDNVTVCFPVL